MDPSYETPPDGSLDRAWVFVQPKHAVDELKERNERAVLRLLPYGSNVMSDSGYSKINENDLDFA